MPTPDTHKIKRALISVSDKTGILKFAQHLNDLGVEIYSTGGTASMLKNAGLPVKNVSDLTGFPEILDGRVKTLHPAVHAGLLAQLDKEEHLEQLKKHNLESIDLLVVNLYPFEETLAKNAPHEEMIENIDIGGPTMLRAAAKNYLWTAVVVNPDRYIQIINLMRERGNTIPENLRVELAGEVFDHTAYYDSIISGYFRRYNHIEFPDKITFPARLDQNLRYGENPHQRAVLYGNFTKIFKQLHGKELSYNNIIDIDGASRVILEFNEPAVSIVKHTNPCGVATGNNMIDAFNKAFATDNVSAYGGIVAFTDTINKETAEAIHSIFTEVLIAPDFTDEALQVLSKKKDRRLIKVDYNELRAAINLDVKSVTGGFLVQASDTQLLDEANMKVVTKRHPTDDEMKALLFGWKVAKHVKSNAIVYTSKDRTLGIGAGQMSRVDSARIAVEKAKIMGLSLKDSCVASDAYFPFADGILQAVDAGATAVIEPGGSVRDNEVIAAADEHNIAMVFTGMRHFRHG